MSSSKPPTQQQPFDGIVTITDPNGDTVVNAQDTGTDETVNFYSDGDRRIHHHRAQAFGANRAALSR